MAKIGELLVEVTAGTSGLREEMKKAKEEVKQSGKQIQDSGRETAVVFDMQGRKLSDFRGGLKKMNEPIEGVRSALNALGVAGGDAVGTIGQLTQGFTNAAGKAGVIGAAIVGVGFAVNEIIDHIKEADQLAAKKRILGLDPDLLDELTAKFPDLKEKSVVALAAAGEQAGLTKTDIVRLGEAARDEAAMSGKAFDEGLTSALKRLGSTADQVRAKTRAFLAGFYGQQAGDTSQFSDEDFNKKAQEVTDAEAALEATDKRLGELSRGEVSGTDSFIARETARLEGLRKQQRATLAQLRADLKAIVDAKEEIETATREEEKPKSTPTQSIGPPGARELPSAIDLLNKHSPGYQLGDANDILLGAAQGRVDAQNADNDAAMGKLLKESAQLKAAQDRLEEANRNAADSAAEQWAQAGVSAAGQFASAFSRFLDSKDPKDLFGGILRAAAGIVGAIPGLGGILGGGALGILGGFFAEGGMVRGPGTSSSDSIPAMLSDGEFVVRASAVRRFGSDFFDRINNMQSPVAMMPHFASGGMVGRASSGAGVGGMTVVQNVMAFDAPTIERNSGRLEGVQQRRVTNRQGAGWQEAVRHAVMTPRWA